MPARRLYYDDAFLREYTADVVSCTAANAGQAAAWSVVLSQTAFYPDSGGQPHDTGLLGDARVLNVQEAGEEIIHLTDKPVVPGHVTGKVDWERRFDHMQQHTGQHLLSAVFQKHFGLPTISFHLGSDVSTIDLHGPEPPEQSLKEAEDIANAIVFEDRPVTVRYGTAEELEGQGIRRKVDRGGILRAIEIEGIDLQPCGGTHVRRAGQIGMILVRRCSKIRQDWRVEFLCGERARRAARADFELLRAASAKLTCGPGELLAALDRAQEYRNSQAKTQRELIDRLAQAEAHLLIESAESVGDGLRLVAIVRDDADAEFLGRLATSITKSERTVALIISRAVGQAVFAQHPAGGKDMNALLRGTLQATGGKGGGTRDFARGRLSDASQCENALALARNRLTNT